jgi:transcriptional regulator with GAF, ATPase, and Fis domain
LDHPVLIQGETGTGKELVARSIHGRSSRREGPFVPDNCAAVPPDLFESAFFGHERGAFTGAVESVPGYFEQARGGTLFLDEIGDLRLDAQAKFLRVIDFREVRRLGGTRAIRVDARVVAATNVDLEDAVRRGVFREDLFWRLRAFMLRLPPVRERGEDIGRLIDATLAKLRMELGLAHIGISDAARAVLLTHPWRGNVREVESVLRCAALLSGSGAIESPHLELAGSAEGAGSPEPGFSASLLPEGSKLSAFLASEKSRVERILIEAALKSSSGVRSVAAAKLGLDPRTLYTKMRQYDLGTLLDQPRSR